MKIERQLANTCQQFQDMLFRIACAANQPIATVWHFWCKYSNACEGYDQSPLLPEFVEWYAGEMSCEKALLHAALTAESEGA